MTDPSRIEPSRTVPLGTVLLGDEPSGTDPAGTDTAGAAASVTFRRRYPVPSADLWAAVTDPDRLAAWMGPVHGTLAVGARYEVRMGADEPGSDQNATGTVLSCDPPHGYAVGWEFPGEETSTVEIRVEPAEVADGLGAEDAGAGVRGADGPGPHDAGAGGPGAFLVLRHAGLGDGQAVGYGAGWHTSLDRLADHLAGREVREWDALFASWLPRYRDAAGR